jgi:hypothetical protein
MQMFQAPFDAACAAMRKSVSLYRFLRQSDNCLFVPYDMVTGDSAGAVQLIADYLELDVPETRILEIAALTSIGRMRCLADAILEDSPGVVRDGTLVYDHRTLLHRNHVRNGGSGYGRDLLSREEWDAVTMLSEEMDVAELGAQVSMPIEAAVLA